ncbi:MAG: HAMP domain-containing protein [Chloroflexaceae bacterium]|nr:HAMP domain-containing protein [Chloroflexaceae bacterium]
MAAETDYEKEYEQAKRAYLQGDFEEAAHLLNNMVSSYPDDPTVLLLRGHVYCYGLHQYSAAREQYEAVLALSQEEELRAFAERGLQQIHEWEGQNEDGGIASSALLDEGEEEMTGLLPSGSFNPRDEDVLGQFDFGQFSERFSDDDFPGSAQEDELHSFVGLEEDLEENPFDGGPATEAVWQRGQNLESDAFSFLEEGVGASRGEEGQFPLGEEPTFVVSSNLAAESPGGLDYLGVDHTMFQGNNTPSAARLGDSSQAEERTGSEDQDSLAELDAFQGDIDDFSHFDLADVDRELSAVSSFSSSFTSSEVSAPISTNLGASGGELGGPPGKTQVLSTDDPSLLSANFGSSSERLVKPTVEVPQGPLKFLNNSSLRKKQLLVAAAAGVTSLLVVAIAGFAGWGTSKEEAAPRAEAAQISILALTAGVFGFGGALLVGQVAATQMKRSLSDIQSQFDLLLQGDFDAKATVYAEDELGELAAGFNQMSRVVLTATKDAQRRAEETEQAREDLQRQVIRLLDEVEGAARGDLTVQAEVTADVLGAVADAFNLTIQNLREIVQQVKQASQQVNRGSTDSELFARNQSSDALRMAEELAVTLNSVQLMTESIQRVAENAREAEEVARTSSLTALRGGEAVERTVAGILQIRETVSETARKVKRLAEASQEISKIVALISQIASRTNLLALNASIQAARAGEAGRGFAIVADEVRQLADRSAKSLKEIEQIVLQIQSETGSVMTAMEEGIQQVIDVTDRAEQAKKSLEDIIEVSNHIDSLVRSITADTVEQRENSLAVAQVMQSVELTAQETSQESQRVAGSLQTLVGISQELLASVERFRVSEEV